MLNRKQAVYHSATAFLNSFFLEHKDFKIDAEKVILPLGPAFIEVPLHFCSLVGRHRYQGSFFLTEPGSQRKEISFEELVQRLCSFLSPERSTQKFLDRVRNSTQNISTTLEARIHDLDELYRKDLNFPRTEQALFLGHTFHPTPKSRSEFSDEDFLRYSPEMGSHFPLYWILVKKELVFEKHSQHFHREAWMTGVFREEFPDASERLKKDYLPFVLHPWQKTHLYSLPLIQKYLNQGDILEVGFAEKEWIPTSSLRTLYRLESQYQLKFSLSVRLTNSLRNLLVHELDRGLQVHEVFTHALGKKFLSENPQFEVIHEPVYAAIKDENGLPLQESLVMGRLNPFDEDKEVAVLATLTQEHPISGLNLVTHFIQKLGPDLRASSLLWFKEFLLVAIRPLLKAQADYGILLGSHQQNLLLEMKDNLPVKSYFRDCNGTGYTKLGFKLFGQDVPSLCESNGNILEGEVANYLFGYYVIINSTFNTLSAVARPGWITEGELLLELRKFLTDLRLEKPRDPSFLNYLLESETLKHKGNFFCSLNEINENTTRNPLSIYTEIPNPLFERTLTYANIS